MGTIKPKIQGYVERTTFEHFEIYRQAKGLSQSQALDNILCNFFGTEQEVNQNDQINELRQYITKELKRVLERVARLEIAINLPSNLESELPSNLESELPSNLESELPSNLESELPSNLESELPSNLESELPSNLESELPSNLESELPSNLESVLGELEETENLFKGLSQRALSKRLNCSHAYICKKEQEGSFTSLSASLDSEGISWELKGKKYYPVTGKSIAPKSTDLESDLSPFVIYAFDREANQYYYWEGVGKDRRGFGSTLPHALKYKTETTAQKSLEGIYQYKDNKHYAYAMDAERFKIGFDTENFLRANRHTGVNRDR